MTTPPPVRIGAREIGPGCPVYLIAEIGSNHNQDRALALEMIDMAASAGANAVKFQSIRFDELYLEGHEDAEFREWFRQIELDESWYADLAARAAAANVDFLSAPTYERAVDLLEACEVPAYKLASPQVQGNLAVVRRAARTGKPLIMSTGYCLYPDIERAVTACESEGNRNIVALHCISKYPTDPAEANLRFMDTLATMIRTPVGYSDHSLGPHLAVAAVARGACAIEKHVTTDRDQPGPDHHFAMTFEEFGDMAGMIRDVSLALGSGERQTLLPDEMKHREFVALKAFAARDFAAGEAFDAAAVMAYRSQKKGLAIEGISAYEGRRTRSPVARGTLLTPDLFTDGSAA